MVQAILNGTKTQTRRIVKPTPLTLDHGKINFKGRDLTLNSLINHASILKGDILWVRETFYKTTSKYLNGLYYYKASIDEGWDLKWKPSIFMPKDACRIWLKVTNVRVERLKDISKTDAIAEGIKELGKNGFNNVIYKNYPSNGSLENGLENPKDSFFSLWESINGKTSLDANPWVWVYEFERCEMPKDFVK